MDVFDKKRGERIRELAVRVDGLALAVEVGVAHAVGIVVTAVGIAETSKTVIGVGTSAGVTLADVVVVVGARMRSEGKGVSVGLPRCEFEVSSRSDVERMELEPYQTSISAQQPPREPTPALGSLVEASQLVLA